MYSYVTYRKTGHFWIKGPYVPFIALALRVSSGDGGRAEAFPGEAATTVD
jgi:hypothetical protein